MFRKNSGIEKFQAKEGGSFTVEIFSSHRTEKTSPGNHSVFQKISGREKYFMDKRGGYHDFPSKFLSHCTEIFHWRTLWCFRKILLSKNFMHWRGGGGGASWFCRNFLSHRTETKSFVKELFCFPEIFWYRKKNMDKRGLITIFIRNFYVSQCQNFPKRILLFLRKFFCFKSFMDEKGGYHVLPSKIFGLTLPKIFVGIPSMFQKIWGIEKFYA